MLQGVQSMGVVAKTGCLDVWVCIRFSSTGDIFKPTSEWK